MSSERPYPVRVETRWAVPNELPLFVDFTSQIIVLSITPLCNATSTVVPETATPGQNKVLLSIQTFDAQVFLHQ